MHCSSSPLSSFLPCEVVLGLKLGAARRGAAGAQAGPLHSISMLCATQKQSSSARSLGLGGRAEEEKPKKPQGS
ncbi:hypothetical protein GUJ93_ZPchr0009g2339 [Zizania palustris]|uniref:Uncharacterized protein n=1 Tax=Zizania palustris TaxID=103762 RepID=A0A8J5V8K7_ZIZPA|nr:hypothetical protein GUJ93_ZPchr0009g2339 [Zizania palustris]